MADEMTLRNGPCVRCGIRNDEWILEVAPGTSATIEIACPLADIRRVLGTGHLDGPRLEEAITRTEDLIMPILDRLPADAELQVTGADMERIRALLPPSPVHGVSIASVEQLFNQLADRAMGSVSSWPHALAADAVALQLVLLREFMHHGGFDSFQWG